MPYVPGIIITLAYLVNDLCAGPRQPVTGAFHSAPRPVRTNGLHWDIWGIAVLALFIGGIYTGFFTPTEAGAVGATWALLLTILARKFTWPMLRDSINETIRTTGIFSIVIGAFIFGQFLAVTRLPSSISVWITSLPVAPVVVIIGIVIFYLILGLFIDMVAAMFITLPILLPAVLKLGYDPIWFGVLVVFLAEIALAMPPFGLGLFIINGVIQDKLGEIVQGVLPFIVADMVILAILVAWPQLVLFLPNLM